MGPGLNRARAVALAAVLLACCGGAARAQVASVRVYSALQRIDPFGEVVPADRAGIGPREILSPGIARNAYTSYHLAVTVQPGASFSLYVGQNPEGFLGVTVYKEIFVQRGGDWIPDGLERVELPYTSRLPDANRAIPGQTTVVFLMELWTPRDAALVRTKVEPQLHVNERWISYPMEVRILPAVVPDLPATGLMTTAAVGDPADLTARAALRTYLCDAPPGDLAAPGTLLRLIAREVRQDLTLARSLEKSPGSILLPEILKLAGSTDSAKWCQAPVFPRDLGPEWYLRLRDALYRMVN
jgi:hypothetical protein